MFCRWFWCLGVGIRPCPPFHIRMPVHSNIRNIIQDFSRAITARLELEQVGRIINKLRRIAVIQKCLVLQQIDHKGNIGTNPANTKFAQCTIHPRNRRCRRWARTSNFYQQAIIITRDHSPRISRTTIKTHAHTRS